MLCGLFLSTLALLFTPYATELPADATLLSTFRPCLSPFAVAGLATGLSLATGAGAGFMGCCTAGFMGAVCVVGFVGFCVAERRFIRPILAFNLPPVVGLTPRGRLQSSGTYSAAAAPVGYFDVSVRMSGESGSGAIMDCLLWRGTAGEAYMLSGLLGAGVKDGVCGVGGLE